VSSRVLCRESLWRTGERPKNDNGHTNGKLNHKIRLPIRLHLVLKVKNAVDGHHALRSAVREGEGQQEMSEIQ
jgi:hypothetical protein